MITLGRVTRGKNWYAKQSIALDISFARLALTSAEVVGFGTGIY